MKKSKRVFGYTVSVLVITYGLAILFPQGLFSNRLDYKSFTVYYSSDDMDTKRLESVLDESIELLSASDLFKVEKNQKIFLCGNFSEFTFFALRSRKSFAINYPLVQNVFLSQSNVLENRVKRNDSEYNSRTLSGVIAHETTHSLLEDKLGFFKYKLLPYWKNEGYCDYVSKESSYDERLGWAQICGNQSALKSRSYAYFKYRTYVEFLLKSKKIAFSSFLSDDFDLGQLDTRVKQNFCQY